MRVWNLDLNFQNGSTPSVFELYTYDIPVKQEI